MDNKIFIGQLTKMFPETKQQTAQSIKNKLDTEYYHDELDMIDIPLSAANSNPNDSQ